MTEFRFGFNSFALRSRRDFVEFCRTAESYGYDVFVGADHLGSAAPFSQVVAAAAATERLRVGTLVLNIGFWNPHLLARETATADVLTEGRFELGLGAGHMKWEFDTAGIDWEPFARRAGRLADTIGSWEDRCSARSSVEIRSSRRSAPFSRGTTTLPACCCSKATPASARRRSGAQPSTRPGSAGSAC
jgi:probable F420-dependent oxidoreductase